MSVPLSPYTWIPWIISLVCLLALGWAVYRSKHETAQMKAFEQDLTAGGGAPVEKTPAADARIAAPD